MRVAACEAVVVSKPASLELSLEPGGAHDEHAADARHVVAHVQGARARGRHDAVGADGRAEREEPRDVVRVVVHRVVRHVDDVVAGRGPGGRAPPARRAPASVARYTTPSRSTRRSTPRCYRLRMPVGPRSPFYGTDRLIVDGTNLLFRLGGGGRAAPPAAVDRQAPGGGAQGDSIDLVFDGQGHGVFGRLAEGMFVRYSGRRIGDDVILDLVGDAMMEAGGGPAAAAEVLVVSNDRELRERILGEGQPHRAAPVAHRADGAPGAPVAGRRQPSRAGRVRHRTGRQRAERGRTRGRPTGLEAGPRGDLEDRRAAQGRAPQAPPAGCAAPDPAQRW